MEHLLWPGPAREGCVMASERPEPEVEEAGQVFLLMKKDYRISRNVRLAWFLNHLHQTVQATPQEMLVRPRNIQDTLGWPRRI